MSTTATRPEVFLSGQKIEGISHYDCLGELEPFWAGLSTVHWSGHSRPRIARVNPYDYWKLKSALQKRSTFQFTRLDGAISFEGVDWYGDPAVQEGRINFE